MAMVRAAMVNSPHVATHRPADDFAGEEIEHDGQIEPPFLGWHVGDVGEPNLIGPLGGEFLVEPVGGDRQIVMAVGGAYPKPPWRYCPDTLMRLCHMWTSLLMSVPGIGVLSALAYVSTVEDPARFGQSRSVGAHLGLTPRQYQSGEVDRSGRISRCGDTLARTLLYEAAVVILSRVKRASRLKDWARVIAKRSGNGKARVALARKLSVILHSVWRSGEPFRWSEHERAA